MADAPQISFCVPVFNAGATIERCLRAVLVEAGDDAEILVVDNASTDDTVASAERLLANHARARVVRNARNLGRIENWNRCVELATGRYLRFATANNVLLPGSTRQLLAGMANATVMAYGPVVFSDNPLPSFAGKPKILASTDALLNFAQAANETTTLDAIVFAGDALRQHAVRFDPTIPYWADFHFILQTAALGPVARLAEPVAFFDRGQPGRYATAAKRAPGFSSIYYFEARRCALLLDALLRARGADATTAFDFLYGMYRYNASGAPPLSLGKTRELFAGSPRGAWHYVLRWKMFQWEGWWRGWRARLRHRLRRTEK